MAGCAVLATRVAHGDTTHKTPAKTAPPRHAEPPPQDRETDTSEPPRGTPSRSLFEVEVGGEAAGRTFHYVDGLSGNLRSYDVAPAAMIAAVAEAFPFTEATGVLRDIGVTGSYARSLSLESSLSGSGTIGTVESAYSVGLRVRIHPWGDDGPIVGVSNEYAAQSFVFNSAGPTIDPQVPSVDYQANRTAVDGRIPFGRFALLASAGFRAVVSGGDVASRFRATSVAGIDGQLGGAATIVSGLEGRIVFNYERYFYAFQPIPGDTYVAGGALDQFFGARLAVAYIF
jgi:hypothetical protein